jgi:hypothetical protein
VDNQSTAVRNRVSLCAHAWSANCYESSSKITAGSANTTLMPLTCTDRRYPPYPQALVRTARDTYRSSYNCDLDNRSKLDAIAIVSEQMRARSMDRTEALI